MANKAPTAPASTPIEPTGDGVVMVREKNFYPNLDFPTGPAYYLMGFEIPIFTPIFVISRITGWTAHVMEQRAANKLVRPLSNYVGVPQRDVVPIERR